MGVSSVLPGRVQRQQDRWKLQVQIFSCTLAGWGGLSATWPYSVSRTAGSFRYRYLAVHWRGGEGFSATRPCTASAGPLEPSGTDI